MKFNSLLALAALTVPALGLDKPLDIKVTHQTECSRKTQQGDKISMHYRGTLEKDGSEFDASYKRGTPLSFVLGTGQVIKGWDEGLKDMCPGDKRTLTIQPEYGYGERGIGPIPGNAVLSELCRPSADRANRL